jgi:carbamate kinase
MSYLEGMQERFAVIALGGNAILKKGQEADPGTQIDNLRIAVNNLESALNRYTSFAITHGNGPQVGNDLLRSYHAWISEKLPELGIADCVSNTQGRIGHWLSLQMHNNERFRHYPVACVLTHVYVDKNEFKPDEYVKYIGPWRPNNPSTRAELDERGIVYRVPDGQDEKLRRVVPSPNPYAIEEFGTIANLLENGVITICCGGGGIPVFDTSRLNGGNEPLIQSDVVIDKDRVSALLAAELLKYFDGADVDLVILMETAGLYRTSECRPEDFIRQMTLEELEEFIDTTELDPGSILPKLEAIRYFLRAGGRHAFLGPLGDFEEVFDPESDKGTVFINSEQLNLY